MTQFYPSLFCFHLLGATIGNTPKKNAIPQKNGDQKASFIPRTLLEQTVHNMGSPLFVKQKQLLDLIEHLGLFRPEQQSLNNILAYASGKQKTKDNDNYDAQGTLSVCN